MPVFTRRRVNTNNNGFVRDASRRGAAFSAYARAITRLQCAASGSRYTDVRLRSLCRTGLLSEPRAPRPCRRWARELGGSVRGFVKILPTLLPHGTSPIALRRNLSVHTTRSLAQRLCRSARCVAILRATKLLSTTMLRSTSPKLSDGNKVTI